MEGVLGDDSTVKAVGHGTITFQRETMSPMVLRDVLFVPGLKKNLVSVSMIEDRFPRVSFCCSCNCFPKFLKFWTLLSNFVLLGFVLDC